MPGSSDAVCSAPVQHFHLPDDRVGVLFDALYPFKEEDITLSMIESRPSKLQNWEYYFFIDLHGHQEDENVARALEKLRPMTQALRILGSYPRGEEPK